MSTPQETIQDDIKTAMKARDKERTSTLRMLLTEMKNERIKTGDELDQDAFYAVIKRLLKQRRDAATQYRDGDREELAAKEEREAEMLESYLPQQIGEDEIRTAVAAFISEQQLSGPQGIGPVMREMMGRFGASADGGTISRLAKELLTAPADGG